MQAPEATPVPTSSWKRPARLAAVVSLSFLAAACLLVVLNASWPSDLLVLGVQATSVLSLGFGVLAVAAGLRHYVLTRPHMRRAVLFVAVLTLVVFLMHMYIINSPPAATQGTPLSGAVGTSFSDSHLSVSSELVGNQLSVSVTNVGDNAIGSVSVALGNSTLPDSGFATPPSYAIPLQPPSAVSYGYEDRAQGTWTVPSSSASALTVTYEYLTCYHVPDENDHRGVFGCVMDETYYVPAAQTLLAGTKCATYVPNCNLEHPFLAKALMAAGIAVFGVTDLGWRISNVILGTLSIPILFAFVYLVSGNRKLSYLASLIFAADTLFFVHSSAGLIDVPSIFFSLLGFSFYFLSWSYRKVDHFIVSGVFFGLALLSKETALFALAVIPTYELIFGGGGVKASALKTLKVVLPAAVVFIVGVQLYDSLFMPASGFPYFYQHLEYMLSYGAGLRGGGWTDSTLHTFITPLNWLTFYSPISYLVTSVTVSSGNTSFSYAAVGYYGVANVVVVWMVYAWLPVAIYRTFRNRKWKATPSGDDTLALFLAVWFLLSYLPYVLLWLYGRVTYPFYILPAVPALAGGAAYFVTREWFSNKLAIVYLIAAFALFFLYFPVKDFLPVFIRALLGR